MPRPDGLRSGSCGRCQRRSRCVGMVITGTGDRARTLSRACVRSGLVRLCRGGLAYVPCLPAPPRPLGWVNVSCCAGWHVTAQSINSFSCRAQTVRRPAAGHACCICPPLAASYSPAGRLGVSRITPRFPSCTGPGHQPTQSPSRGGILHVMICRHRACARINLLE